MGIIGTSLDGKVKVLEAQKQLIEKEIEFLKLQESKQPEPVIQEEHLISPWDVVQQGNKKTWKGTASYYSVDGCVGCREDLLMANGKRFDENAMTLAFNWLPLNTEVVVKNVNTGTTVNAVVTDTGGFNELGRIADLSKGLKEALNCNDLCQVEIIK